MKKKGYPSSVILAELFPQNVLSPEGRCVYASPVRVQLFLLMFYPPKGDTQYLTRGPFVFTYVLFGVSKSLEHFKNL